MYVTGCDETWFIKLFHEDLEVHNESRFTMMSDRQKRLEKALGDFFPSAEIRFWVVICMQTSRKSIVDCC